MTAKRIQQMDYGTPAQHREADAWYARFLRFAEAHPILSECVWNCLHNDDVWYSARRRWLDVQPEGR